MIAIPDRTIEAVVRQFGQAGREWLQAQPARLESLGVRWHLSFGEPFDVGLPVNVVYRVSRDGAPCVLKTGYPHPEIQTEMAVLERWIGRPACVQLIDSDRSAGCMLMEQILPGTRFRSFSRHHTEHDASLMVRGLFEQIPLAPDSNHDFPGYADWCARAFSTYRQNHQPDWFVQYLDQAGKMLAQITARHEPGWLLHGDLHHENILVGEAGYCVAVDPKGVTGPKVLEYGRYIHNFLSDRAGTTGNDRVSVESIVSERVSALAGAYSRETLLDVGFVDLVLSCCWTLNSGEQLDAATIQLIELMSSLSR